MKNVKYLLFLLFVSCFGFSVYAENTVTLNEINDVINDGVITDEYIEILKDEVDSETGKKKWIKVSITSDIIDDNLVISYSLRNNDETISGEITPTILEDGKTLKYVLYFNEEDADLYKYDVEIMNLIPLWEIEASDKFSEVKKYIKSNYIDTMNSIIDRCYRQEMHVCRTSVSTYGELEYISDVEMNDEPVNYLLNVLEEQKEKEDNDRLMAVLTVIAIILIILLLVVKSITDPKKKAIKY